MNCEAQISAQTLGADIDNHFYFRRTKVFTNKSFFAHCKKRNAHCIFFSFILYYYHTTGRHLNIRCFLNTIHDARSALCDPHHPMRYFVLFFTLPIDIPRTKQNSSYKLEGF